MTLGLLFSYPLFRSFAFETTPDVVGLPVGWRDPHEGKLATAAGFFAILRQHTSADVKPLIQQYFAHVDW